MIVHEPFFEDLKAREYSRLIDQQVIYLDYTGGNLYSKSQLEAHFNNLSTNTFGNPHSTNPTSQLSTNLVEATREKVLDFFNAQDHYECIFTANATASLKIVGESYPFYDDGMLLLLTDNHNSVNGIREYVRKQAGGFNYVRINYEDLRIDQQELQEKLSSFVDHKNKLFAFPAQSNVSGVKHDLNWIKKAQELGWDVLLDAAAFVPTSKLDLSECHPDFVSISFYKMMGYPTGIGCLLVRKDKFHQLNKQWFAGGTVKLASVAAPHHILATNHERFEDGTINYLDIPAVKIGLDYLSNIGMDRISERILALTNYLVNELKSLKHRNGNALVKIFGHEAREHMGGTVIMNFFDQDKNKIPFEVIEQHANERNISIRSGCFCNPGIDEINNCITSEELAKYFSSRDDGNYQDMVQALNKMRGATRVSVGLANTQKDIDEFINYCKNYLQ